MIRVHNQRVHLLTLLTLALLWALPTFAASPILEDFDDMVLPATLEESDPADAADFSSGAAAFPGVGNSGRNYLRTIEDDYHAVDFTVDATVTVVDGIDSGIAFLGLGAGDESVFFNEPRSEPFLYLRIHPDGFESGILTVIDEVGDAPTESKTQEDLAGTGTHRVRMIWRAATAEAHFQIHKDYAGGPFVPSATLGPFDGSDNEFTASDSRIFFGGSNGITFDDVRVILRPLGLQSTACPIDFTGHIEALGPTEVQVEFFEIELSTDVPSFEIDIDAAVHASSADSLLGLFDSDFNLFAVSDDDAAPGEVSGFDSYLAEGLSAGTYFIGVTAASDFDFDGDGAVTAGPYQLQVDWCDGGGLFSDGFDFGSTIRWDAVSP